jgi:hypothetical protein
MNSPEVLLIRTFPSRAVYPDCTRRGLSQWRIFLSLHSPSPVWQVIRDWLWLFPWLPSVQLQEQTAQGEGRGRSSPQLQAALFPSTVERGQRTYRGKLNHCPLPWHFYLSGAQTLWDPHVIAPISASLHIQLIQTTEWRTQWPRIPQGCWGEAPCEL